MQSFEIALAAVFPLLFYMALGALVCRAGIVDVPFLNRLTSMVFHVFFPFLMLKNVYWTSAGTGNNVGFVVYAFVSVLVVIGLSMLLVPRFEKEDARRGVIVQAIYRSNLTLFTIPLAQSVYGDASGILVALLTAFIIPLYNASAIVILEYFRGGSASPKALIKKIATNPLILGIVAGFLLKLLHVPIPDVLGKPIRTVADLTTPLALFALGGTLRFASVKKNSRVLFPVFGLRMILIPLLSYLVTLMLPFTPMERFMLLLVFATPVATSSYPMAQSMGGDGELAGEFVVITNTGSIVTLFLFVFFLSRAGLLGGPPADHTRNQSPSGVNGAFYGFQGMFYRLWRGGVQHRQGSRRRGLRPDGGVRCHVAGRAFRTHHQKARRGDGRDAAPLRG